MNELDDFEIIDKTEMDSGDDEDPADAEPLVR